LNQPFLSIIIPARNEEHRLGDSLDRIAAFFATQPYPAEVIVVENASTDRTLEIAREKTKTIPYLRVMSINEGGKGLAVKVGMLAATGEYRFICDTDLSMPIEEVNRFIPPALDEDVVIGSREAPGAVRYDEPEYRHVVGRIFNTMVRWIALPGLQDTQCGFKCFKAKVAEEVFTAQTLKGWAFDVEALYIARRRGYHIIEVGIPWYYVKGSRIRLFRDSWRMAMDLLTIRLNGMRGVYGPRL